MDTKGDQTHPNDLNLVGEPDQGRPMVLGQVSGVAVKTRAPVPAVRRFGDPDVISRLSRKAREVNPGTLSNEV